MMNKLAQYLNQHLIGEVVTNAATRAAYATDGSPLTKTPEIVVYPRATNDIRKLLRFVWQLAEKGHTLPVTPRGAGTDRTGGAIGPGVVLAIASHLHTIFEYDAKQRLVRLQPGVDVTSLQNALRLQGAWVPGLGAVADDASIGGVIAAGRTGMSNDWIDQLEIVLANGDTLQTKRLSKRELNRIKGRQGFEGDIYRGIDALIDDNQQLISQLHAYDNSGYSALAEVKRKDGSFDLTPLFVGSQGTLGIISEMIIKTEFSGPQDTMIVGVFDDATRARDALDKIAKVESIQLEYFDGHMVQRAQNFGKRFEYIPDGETPSALLVATPTDSTARAQAKKAKKLTKLIEQFGGSAHQTSDAAEGHLANVRSIAGLALQSESTNSASVPLFDGVYIPPERFETFVEGVAALATKRRVELPLYGLPLQGLWYARPILNLGSVGGKQAVVKLVDEFAQLVASCDGSLSGQNGEGRLHDSAIRRVTNPEILELFAGVKNVFDPHNVLNTGVKQDIDQRTLAGMVRSAYDSAHRDGLARY